MENLLPPTPDVLECMLEIHQLKSKAMSMSDEQLVIFISSHSTNVVLTNETEEVLGKFFMKGELSKEDRKIAEDCYVLLKNYLCVDPSGEVYYTQLITN